MADGSDGEPPFVPPGYDEIYNNPPIEHKPWEAEFYREKFEKLFQDPNFLLGCGVAAAVIVLVIIGTVVHCVLRCSNKRLDKQNEKLAMEIRKKKQETLERKKQILQMRAESEDVMSANHETFHIEDSDSEPSISIMPENNGKPVRLTKRNDDTLKRITSKQSYNKPMFKNSNPADQPNLKIIKKHAPPPPGATPPEESSAKDESTVKQQNSTENNAEAPEGSTSDNEKEINEMTASKITMSTIQDENDMTHVTESFVSQQTSMAPSNMSQITESVTTITDLAKSKLAMNSMSTVATEKSVKIISELENLEKQKDDNSQDENVDARIEDLQNQLLELLN